MKALIIAKLEVTFEHGIKANKPKDIGLAAKVERTVQGQPVRGVGTHYVSAAAKELELERSKEFTRLHRLFRERFAATPLNGTYLITAPGEAKKFLAQQRVRRDVQARVVELNLSPAGATWDAEMLKDWSDKIKRQLEAISLGRQKDEVREEGLAALRALATCPILSSATSQKITELVAAVEAQKITRLELKRSLGDLRVELNGSSLASVSPRRGPKVS